MSQALSRGLEAHGFCPVVETNDRKLKILGVISHCYWKIMSVFIGCYYANYSGTYIYVEPEDHLQYNVNHGLFTTMFISTPMIEFYLKPLEAAKIRKIPNIILDSDAPIEFIERFKSLGVSIFFIDDLIEEGRKSTIIPERQNENSVVYIVSTSGSTGYPKSALLTNESLIYDIDLELGFVHEHYKEGCYMLSNITIGFGSSLAMTNIMICRGYHIMFMERKCAINKVGVKCSVLKKLTQSDLLTVVVIGTRRLKSLMPLKASSQKAVT